ncbi:MAG: sigma-70 family RNA polymerase sigma factor [Gemmatimonadetes bacterium]|nr:sigma-70 family RNA polymerase sigma factor [Gemmatimonadota bacterium]
MSASPPPDHVVAPPAAPSAEFEAEALRWLPDVSRFARSLTRDAMLADDLVQETYLNAWRGAASFRADADMRRWLFAICHHAWLRLAQREQRYQLTDEGLDAELETLAAVRGHASAHREGLTVALDTIDLPTAIAQALDALPAAFRVATQLVDVEGFSYDDAAAVLGVPVGTIRSRLFRARRLLQEALFAHARDLGFGRAGRADRTPDPSSRSDT